MPAYIEGRNVNLTFRPPNRAPVRALQGFDIEIREGEFLSIVGPSGCGKSTFLNVLLGLIRPDSGDISMHGKRIAGPGTDRAMVFQEFGLLPWRTVQHNVELGLELKGVRAEPRRSTSQHFIELVGLSGFEQHYPHELSGGMKQRVGLARALATDPEIMLFDEPFSALDPLIRRDMQDEVIRLQREVRKTMLFITHDLMEALKLGDRIAIMKDGAFVQVGTPEEVVSAPADDYVADFIRDVPRAHVLTARTIMAPAPVGDGLEYGGDVAATTVVQELLPMVVHTDLPLRVVDGSQTVGVVDRTAVMTALLEDR